MAAVVSGVGDEIALLVVVGESAEFELFPQAEVAQLDFRPQPDIAGEQAENRRAGQGLEGPEHLPHAAADLGLAAGQNVVEPESVPFEEALKILRRRGNVVVLKTFAHQAEIGASRKAHFIQTVLGVELRGEGFGKSLRPRVPRADERAVDVEQDQFYHPATISERRKAASFLGGATPKKL